ncbi:MAG: asparagine synthase (glutamine-hydrolyzing) [Candidatus Binatia bacterium]
MCGIVGILHSGGRPVDPHLITKMCARLAHRGPDDEGTYVSGSVAMGMRRLVIIDVAGGQQPITNEDGSVIVTFNGEIYNFRALRTELEQYGHNFSTNCDTEVIVHAYEQWGDEALRRFNGMFALTLWDDRRKRLLLARDRMGKKPLYWHLSPAGLVWASEAKALLVIPWIERHINALALHHYLTLQYTPDPLTIFEGISQLPAAHKLVVEYGKEPTVSRWWKLQFEPKIEMTEGDYIAQARASLAAAVERRLMSEVPLGAFLSGGIDSSIIVALMAERLSEPVKTFSIGFEEPGYSEAQYAKQVAQRYHTEHHEFIFRPNDLVRVIEGVIAATDEPFADPAALPLYELARLARQSVTVVLCGDGGDETLAGYSRYAFDKFFRFYSVLPVWFTQRLVPSLTGWLPEPTWLPEDRNPVSGLKRLGQVSATTPKASLVRWGSYFPHEEKLALYTDRWRDEFSGVDTAEWVAAAYDEACAMNLLDRTLYADHVTYLAGDLLPKTDRMTMAHSVEARAPFLDTDWVEWTARLPRHYKIRGLKTKWLLKSAFADKLPSGIVKRGKQGFSLPIGAWLRHELRGWARAYLLETPALNEWFCSTGIQRLLSEHDRGLVNHGKRLWALLMFSLWLEQSFRER